MTARSTVDARLTAAALQQIDAICDRFEVDLRRPAARTDVVPAQRSGRRRGCSFSGTLEPRASVRPRNW